MSIKQIDKLNEIIGFISVFWHIFNSNRHFAFVFSFSFIHDDDVVCEGKKLATEIYIDL